MTGVQTCALPILVSRIGSKADGKLSFDYSIPQPGDVVKKYLKDDIPDEAAPVLFAKYNKKTLDKPCGACYNT